MPGDLAARLEDSAGWRRQRVAALREAAYQDEHEAHRKRAEADAIELEIVEDLTAARIIREAGLAVDRDERGDPRIKVERTFAERPALVVDEEFTTTDAQLRTALRPEAQP